MCIFGEQGAICGCDVSKQDPDRYVNVQCFVPQKKEVAYQLAADIVSGPLRGKSEADASPGLHPGIQRLEPRLVQSACPPYAPGRPVTGAGRCVDRHDGGQVLTGDVLLAVMADPLWPPPGSDVTQSPPGSPVQRLVDQHCAIWRCSFLSCCIAVSNAVSMALGSSRCRRGHARRDPSSVSHRSSLARSLMAEN